MTNIKDVKLLDILPSSITGDSVIRAMAEAVVRNWGAGAKRVSI